MSLTKIKVNKFASGKDNFITKSISKNDMFLDLKTNISYN